MTHRVPWPKVCLAVRVCGATEASWTLDISIGAFTRSIPEPREPLSNSARQRSPLPALWAGRPSALWDETPPAPPPRQTWQSWQTWQTLPHYGRSAEAETREGSGCEGQRGDRNRFPELRISSLLPLVAFATFATFDLRLPSPVLRPPSQYVHSIGTSMIVGPLRWLASTTAASSSSGELARTPGMS
jgi:hypothetical protein